MKKMVFALLCVVFCSSFINVAYAGDVLPKDTVMYTRSNLRAQGTLIEWHNMKGSQVVIPAGTEVKLVSCSGIRIEFTKAGDKKTYRIISSAKLWSKYLVKDKKEIGFEAMNPEMKAQVEKGAVVDGMSKAEVYASRGCPAYIKWGEKSDKHTFEEVMNSDKWYYMINSRGKDTMVTFKNGVVAKTGGFEQ